MTPQSRSNSVSRRTRLLGAGALASVFGLVAAGCGSAAGDRPPSPQRTPAASAARQIARPAATRDPSASSSRSGVTVKVMQTQYGNVLVDGNGRALYLFTRDRTP